MATIVIAVCGLIKWSLRRWERFVGMSDAGGSDDVGGETLTTTTNDRRSTTNDPCLARNLAAPQKTHIDFLYQSFKFHLFFAYCANMKYHQLLKFDDYGAPPVPAPFSVALVARSSAAPLARARSSLVGVACLHSSRGT